ncbi:FtsX-like permease family protein [Pseudonocardia sp. GCM10023141]|uniref:FtsX-like permease family protein n=1 Tax=Pseudonocardia sp. GCM10023141 TaxID=3252653 RepID=UPI003618CC67
MIGPTAGALLTETRRRPGRLVLTGLAITVATVFAAGTMLLSETLRAYLTDGSSVTPVAAAVAVVPHGGAAGELVARAAGIDGVAQAVGVWQDFATVTGAGAGTSWMVVSDPMRGPLTRLPAPPTAGRLPAAADEVAISAATAARIRIAPGATLTVATPAGARIVTVTGVVAPSKEPPVDTLLATPEAVAGFGGHLEQVDLTARPGVAPATLLEAVRATLGTDASVQTGAQRRDAEAADASASVSAVVAGIGVFAGLAVVAAIVVVASTFRIVLTQRRTQLALLRCVGAARGQVTRAVLAEAVVTGFVAGVIGIAIAVLGGYGVVAVLPVTGVSLVIWWPGVVGCLLLAVLATVVAAVAPALAAGRIPPVAALGSAGAGESGAPRRGRRIGVAGVLAAAAAALAWAGVGGALGTSIVGTMVVAVSGLVAFAALVAIGPLLVRGLATTIGRGIAAIGGGPGRLAVANATDVPRRTAATISVLALGAGLTSALLVALASVGASSAASIAENFPSDIVIGTDGAASAASIAARLAGDPRLVVRAAGSSVLVDPAPGVPEGVARDAVGPGVAGEPNVLVQYAGDARAELETTIGVAGLIGFGLVGMTALVAIVGVGVTLMLSITERTRETGLLRAIGLGRGGVRAMVAWEAALSGAGAAVLGAVLGSAYGVLAVRTLGLGSTTVAVPGWSLAGLVVGVVAVAVLAALIPAVRAGRVAPIRALQDA